MICPMMSFREDVFTKCQRSKCAWWSKENRSCAIKVIAENGGICCQSHGEFEDLEDDETDMEDRFTQAMKDVTPPPCISMDEAIRRFKRTSEQR